MINKNNKNYVYYLVSKNLKNNAKWCRYETIREILGHSNVYITMNIYTHSFTQNKIEYTNVLDKLDEEINNNI